MIYVVDTHALLWYVGDSPRLGARADAVLSDPGNRFAIPAIVLAEACWLMEHGRFPLSVNNLLQALATERRMTVVPLDQETVERCVGLDAILEMHDRQIVATALLLVESGEETQIITRDRNVGESQLVPVLWD